MAKRTTKKKATKSKKSKKASKKTKTKKAKSKIAKSKTTGRRTAKRKVAAGKRKSAAKKQKKRAPRRSEAEMPWPEVRAARRRKSEGREQRIVRAFERAVNMTPNALAKWLETSESASVGTPRKANPSESVGQWSGRRIIEIRNKNPLEYEAEDYAHMRKVAAYVARHSAQRPKGDVKDTRWRYSLMNWGHDPLK
jgi:hypothetical protein